MASPSLCGGGGVKGRRVPKAPPDGVEDAAAAPRRSDDAWLLVPPRVVAAAVVVAVACVVLVRAESIPVPGLSLPAAVGRAGKSLYHSTMQYLMDQLAPPQRPASHRSGAYNPDIACMGAVYRRGGGGSVCVDAVTAALVVGAALLLQFVFYVAVTTVCPINAYTLTGSSYRTNNITYVITVDNSNNIGVDVTAGDQMLTQSQTQDQTQTQTQDQTATATQSAPQRITVMQDQDQTQTQSQAQAFGRSFSGGGFHEASVNETFWGGGRWRGGSRRRRRRRRWSLPEVWVMPLDLSTIDWPGLDLTGLDFSSLSLSLCPLLTVYLGA